MKISIELQNVDVEETDFSFSDSKKKIVVGRNPQSDIVLPALDTRLSRSHLSLEEKLGRYSVYMQADNPVFMDGERLHNGTELPDECTLALGTEDGPTLTIKVERDETLPETDFFTPQQHPGAMAERGGRYMMLNRVIVALVAVALIGAGGFYFWQEERNEARFAEIISGIQTPPVGERESLSDALRDISESVYVVGVRSAIGESGAGTAWVVGDGVLATNAHVAVLYNELTGDQEMFVRSSHADNRTHLVTGIQVHEGYAGFSEFVTENPRFIVEQDGTTTEVYPIDGYDVALLFIEEGEGHAKAIPIAEEDVLNSLRSGDEIGYAGYPMDSNALVQAIVRKPEPVVQRGSVTSLTDYYGVRPDDSNFADLVQHNLPIQGGASGSPIINSKGEAVAVVSHATGTVNYLDQWIDSGIGINFGQRANLVSDMLEGRMDQVMEELPQVWTDQLEPFDAYGDIYASLIDALGGSVQGSDTPALQEQSGVFEARDFDGTEMHVGEFLMELEAGEYVGIAGSPSGQLNLMVVFDNNSGVEYGRDTNAIALVYFVLTEASTIYVGLRSETDLKEEFKFRLYGQVDQS